MNQRRPTVWGMIAMASGLLLAVMGLWSGEYGYAAFGAFMFVFMGALWVLRLAKNRPDSGQVDGVSGS